MQRLKQRALLFFSVLILSFQATAQSGTGNLEFVENKGQWDAAIRFKATLPNVHFYLQQHGFSVLLQNPSDMNLLRSALHESNARGTDPAPVASNASGTKATNSVSRGLPSDGGGKTGGNPSGSIRMHSHLYQVEFLNSSDKVEISGDKPLDTYNNYIIGNDSSAWRSNCKIYQAVVYKNLYPHIDLRYYTENGQLKYDLIVHPGGNPDDIVLRYRGASQLILKNGEVTVRTTVGDVKESIPKTYQFSSQGTRDLECSFVAGRDSTLRFHVKDYSPGATLIIDPTLVFSSFTGSHSDNWGYTATYDGSGNFYSGSITLGAPEGDGNGFLVSPGAFQTVYQGGNGSDDGGWQYDITILKFSSNGQNRLYGTYIGGKNGNEQPHSLIVDGAGNLIIAGRTSSSDYPTVAVGGVKDKPKGNYDILITKLNATGTALLGSRIIGGSGDDGVNIAPKYYSNPGAGIGEGAISLRLNYGDDGRSEVVLDKLGYVYLASCTRSADFPYTNNAFQKTSGGSQDGVFIKTSPDLSNILTATYLGGGGDDAAFALAINPQTNNVYIAGGTASNDFPGTANGPVIAPSKKAGIDGFLSMLSNDGGTLIRSSYFGTDGTEVLYGVQFDNYGFPYIMGTTSGAWPVFNATFVQAGGKQFIAKLKPDLSGYIYSTTFGKGGKYPDISPTAFLVDRCENVYVSGWGGGIESEGGANAYKNSGTTGLTVTSNAIKKSTDGSDFYFFVMQKNAVSQLYGSFFGQTGGSVGDHVDGGTSRFDKQGVIYEAICANCYGGNFPTTPNVWASKNGTGTTGCNLAAVKIAFNFAGVAADPRSLINGRYDSAGCVPLDVVFTDTVHNAKTYYWSFGDGTPDTVTAGNQAFHTFQKIGTFLVQLIAEDSATCNVRDTAYLRIRVRTDRALLDFDITKTGLCTDLSYLFTNQSTPPALKPFQSGVFTWDFGDGTRETGEPNPHPHTYAASGPYIVRLILNDTNYCNSPDSVSKSLRVSPFVKAQFELPDGCAPYTAVINNTSLAGISFLWNFGDGQTSTDINPVHLFADTGTYHISLIATDSNTCNIQDDTVVTIHVDPKPTAAFTTEPVPALYNTPTTFLNNSTGGNRFVWIFGDGDSTVKTTPDTVVHQYQSTNIFNTCLVTFNEFGCSDTVCHPVQSLINPLLDVPNAFTPGRFGQNSVVMVKGFGIAMMNWKIYNRWGQVVFESNNPSTGWDGTYRGSLQPMDVYAYSLDVTFFDGTKTRKTGDITLIR